MNIREGQSWNQSRRFDRWVNLCWSVLMALSILVGASGVAVAADETITSATTWNDTRSYGTLTLNTSQTLTLSAGANVTVTNLVMSSSSRINFSGSATLTVNGTATLGSSAVINGSSIRLRGTGTWNLTGSSSRITGNLDMEAANLNVTGSSASVNADGYGAARNSGPGAGYANTSNGNSGSGASHGGRGTAGYRQGSLRGYYGSAIRPVTPGSGGGDVVRPPPLLSRSL